MVDRFLGSIAAAGMVRGSINLDGNASWLVPVWFQLFYPAVIALAIAFIPESPRWLYINGKKETATCIITRYHGLGESNNVWVRLQTDEYERYLKQDGAVSIPDPEAMH